MTILHYWRIAWRARFIVLGTTVAALLVALVYLQFQHKVYTAQASILAPKESTPPAMGALSALFGGGGGGGRDGGGMSLPSLLGGGPSLSTNQDMFVAILKSRTGRQEVVAELTKKYGADAGSKLLGTDINTREKGVIALTVESTHPTIAADAANLYFEILDQTLDRLAQQATRKLEERYGEQLQRAAKEVSDAEAAVLKFQAQNRVVPLDAATRGAVDAAARAAADPSVNLRATIMSLELQREVLRMRMTEQHPQMREIDKQIAELKKQYSQNLFGTPMDLPGEGPGQRRKEFFVSTEKLTPVQFAYLKLYRTLKIQEAFYTGAMQGLEQLKYNEGVNRVRVEMLDPASPPRLPVRPRVPMTLLLAGVGGLLLPILVIDAMEYFRRVRSEELEAQSRALARDHRPDRRGPVAPAPDDVRLPADPVRARRPRTPVSPG